MSIPFEIALDLSNIDQLVEDSCCVVFYQISDLDNAFSFNRIM